MDYSDVRSAVLQRVTVGQVYIKAVHKQRHHKTDLRCPRSTSFRRVRFRSHHCDLAYGWIDAQMDRIRRLGTVVAIDGDLDAIQWYQGRLFYPGAT
jgi:hypothetical protein